MLERRTQAERRSDSQARLVAAAIHLLGTRGYAGASLAEIGKAAGLSRGLVNHHFGSKEACMRAVVTAIRERARTHLSSDLRGVAALDDLFDVYFGGLADRDDPSARALYVLLVEGITATPGLRDAIAETNMVVRQLIVEMIGDEAADPEAAAVVVEGILRGVALQWLADPDGVELAAAADAAKAAVRGLLAA
ncbi:helix-turn-helix domain-containing protein [Streptomyces sp. NPDC047061]|uniref:TetR/AcrR family transcriptional regulator n=1 Tax=Streptomyces sp. NPDC047061 TaxID=3154605 RepID=UPI0033CF2E55